MLKQKLLVHSSFIRWYNLQRCLKLETSKLYLKLEKKIDLFAWHRRSLSLLHLFLEVCVAALQPKDLNRWSYEAWELLLGWDGVSATVTATFKVLCFKLLPWLEIFNWFLIVPLLFFTCILIHSLFHVSNWLVAWQFKITLLPLCCMLWLLLGSHGRTFCHEETTSGGVLFYFKS